MLVGGVYGTPMANNSPRCNPFLALEVLLGGMSSWHMSLSLYGDLHLNSFIYVYILGAFIIVGFHTALQKTFSVVPPYISSFTLSSPHLTLF